MYQVSTSTATPLTLVSSQQSGAVNSCSTVESRSNEVDQDAEFLVQIAVYPRTVKEALIDLRSCGIYTVARKQLNDRDIPGAKCTLSRLMIFEWNFLSDAVHGSRYMSAKKALLEIDLLEHSPSAALFMTDCQVTKTILSDLQKPFTISIPHPENA